MTILLIKENKINIDEFVNCRLLPFNILKEYKLVPGNLLPYLYEIRSLRNSFFHGEYSEINIQQFNTFKTVMKITSSWLITNSRIFSKYSQYQTKITEKINKDVDKLIESKNVLISSLKERNEYLDKKLNSILENQQIMMSKLDQISDEVKSINSSLNDYQSLIEKITERSRSEDIEMILHIFTEECVNKITNRMDNIITKGQYSEVCSALSVTLGTENFLKLDEETKSFLVSSRLMFINLEKFLDDVDYSGVCLLVTKALERTLKTRFYYGLIDYCKDNYEITDFPTVLTNDSRNKLIRDSDFTLGSIPFLLTAKKSKLYRDKDREVIVSYCKNILFKSSDEKYILSKLIEIAENVERVRISYRNPSAHVNSINKVKAKECFDFVLDVQKTLKQMLNEFKK